MAQPRRETLLVWARFGFKRLIRATDQTVHEDFCGGSLAARELISFRKLINLLVS